MTTTVHTQPEVDAPAAVDAVTVRLVGSFDARSTAAVRDELRAQLALHPLVVVDLSEVHSIDLTALRVLAAASHQAVREGRHLVLRGCGPAVRRLLHLSHLIRAVEVERGTSA